MEDRYQIRKYLDLMDAMLSGDMTATEFESRYLRTYKEDDALRPYEVFTTLDGLFADVDAFVADPALREEGDFDEDQLRERVATARRRLSGSA